MAAQRKTPAKKERPTAKAPASKAKAKKPTNRLDGGAIASKAFKKAERQAAKAVKDPKEAAKLEKKAAKKAEEHKADLGSALEHLPTLLRMVRAYAKGDYRELPTKTIVAAAAAVIYFLNPMDLIPDVIPGVGYVDDIAVLLFAVAALEEDLDAFTAWEKAARTPTRMKRTNKSQASAKKASTTASRSTTASAPKGRTKSASKDKRGSAKPSAPTKAKDHPPAGRPKRRPTRS